MEKYYETYYITKILLIEYAHSLELLKHLRNNFFGTVGQIFLLCLLTAVSCQRGPFWGHFTELGIEYL